MILSANKASDGSSSGERCQDDPLATVLNVEVKVALKTFDEGLILPGDECTGNARGSEVGILQHDLGGRVAIGLSNRLRHWSIAEVELTRAPCLQTSQIGGGTMNRIGLLAIGELLARSEDDLLRT